MLQVTDEILVIAKQPQKLLKDYNVPAAKVADMIRESTAEITQRVNSIRNDHQATKGETGDLAKHQVFFAARRHLYKKNVYVVRITYRFKKTLHLKNKYAVLVSSAEVVAEKDFHPILPL
jgi:hypothetical protein